MATSSHPTADLRFGSRIAAVLAVMTFGVVATLGLWTVARADERDADAARTSSAVAEAVESVQTFVEGVERVLIDSRLHAADVGYDPARFAEHARTLVASSPLVNGVALVDPEREIVASAGPITVPPEPEATGLDPRLVRHATEEDAYLLGFLGGPDGAYQVYLEVWTTAGAVGDGTRAYALVLDDGSILAGNASGSTAVSGPVAEISVGGVSSNLYLELDQPAGLWGVTLSTLLLAAGASLTAALVLALNGALRRGTMITGLVAQQSALGRALDEQRSLAGELRKAQQQWAAVLRDSPDTIAVVDDHHGLRLLNRTEFLGHAAEDLVDQEGLWRLLDVEDRRRFGWLVAVARSVYHRGQVKETAFALEGADGSKRWFSIRLTCTETDRVRGPSETIVTFTDIHDRWERTGVVPDNETSDAGTPDEVEPVDA